MKKLIFLTNIEQDPSYIKLKHPIEIIEQITCVGYFPYSTKRVIGSRKVASSICQRVIHTIAFDKQNSDHIMDNKIVLVFHDAKPFGSMSNFALFYHDWGCIIGELEDIKPY